MLLQEFLDLGFNITFEQLTKNYTRVIKEDERYIEIYNAYSNHDGELGDKLLKDYKIDCRSRMSQGWGNEMKLMSLTLYEDKMSKRVVIEKDNIRLMLYVDKDTNIVDRVLDALWYFGSCSSHTDIYDRESSKDTKSAKDIMRCIYRKRLNNAQFIRNHYNKEIKDLKQKYKRDLSVAKDGLDFLKQFDIN